MDGWHRLKPTSLHAELTNNVLSPKALLRALTGEDALARLKWHSVRPSR
jgi:hypothetical protein